ncbi:MAG: hypothetical protein JXB49_04470 [Bacteroidales bacterium]|nr:hypothetical protein [Bacteroidales bacterium]
MIIEKIKFQEALKIVESGLADKEIPYLAQAKSYTFSKGRIATYNDEISVSHPIEGWEGIEGVVQAQKLYDLLSKLSAKELEIFINKKSELVIKAGKAKAGLTLQEQITLPIVGDIPKSKWKKLPDDFLNAVKFTYGCASTDPTDPILQNIHVNKSGFVESSDAYRVAQFTLSSEMPVGTFLFPAKSAIEMLKLSPVSIAEGDGWIHFKTDKETIFSCRIVNEEFPNTKSHLDVKGSTLTFPDNLKDVILRAMIFAERKSQIDEKIIVTLKNNIIRVRSESEGGWFEEDTPTEFKDEPVIFMATPYLLKDILSETTACVINDVRSKILFEGDSWRYMVALRYEE